MPEVALFVEDFAHQQIIGALIRRLAQEAGVTINLDWRSATRGHGKVAQELKDYLRDLRRQGGSPPALIVASADANCKGLNQRTKQLHEEDPPAPMILAIPHPHVERWLLLDGAAFRSVFGKGCAAPDRKCNRDRYKQRLIHAILNAGVAPSLGGIEFADEIVQAMDIERAAAADDSFKRFIRDARAALQRL